MSQTSIREESSDDAGAVPNKVGTFARALQHIPGDSKSDTEDWNKDFEEQRRQFEREQGSRDIVSASLQGVVRVISNVAILAVAAVAWHFLLPRWLSWLDEKQIQGLLTFLLSGAVIGSVSNFFRQHA